MVERVEGGTLPNAEFRHRQHLAYAFLCLCRDSSASAERRVLRTLAAFAERNGEAGKFHVSLTLCWTRLVAAAMTEHPECRTARELLERHPALLDKNLPLRFYSRDLLFGEAARRGPIAPDLGALPPARESFPR